MTSQQTRRVIIGIQDSAVGLQALRHGVTEARRQEATLCLARAYPTAAWSAAYAVAGPTLAELAADAAKLSRDLLQRAVGAVPAGVSVQVFAVRGAPGPALVALADRDDDLLVVGDAQRHGVRRLCSGVVARYCVRHAGCPVLVVPPPALARTSAADVTREAQRLIDAA